MLESSPIEVCDARVLFPSTALRQRQMASLIRLDSGRLVLSFRCGRGSVRANDGVLAVSHSDDEGETWTAPRAVYSYPGWDCLNMGGLMRFADDRIVLALGRLQMDHALPGEEPCTGWHMSAIVSRDGAETWSPPGPEIRLFPCWTELYGASNPHPLKDGRFMLAAIGTDGRDAGWQAGVTFTSDQGRAFSPPVVVAKAAGRGFGDMDIVRLPEGPFLAVARVFGGQPSVYAHSHDEGRSWTPPRSTGFSGANVKLIRLRSGAVLCAYRDEGGRRAGVSCSVSEDGGESWRFIGQLYAAGAPAPQVVGSHCGYPDMVALGGDDLACVLHPCPDSKGRVHLHWLRLRDRT